MRGIACAIAALMMTGSVAAYAQDGSMASPSTMAPMSPTGYVTAAGQSDQFEIQEGKLAESMGGTAKVRAFGKKMVHDHMKSTKMVMAAAMASGLPQMPPPPLRSDQQQMMAQLQGTSGKAFDAMYVQQQMQSHQEALALQQGYAQNGTDANLRGAAAKIVPVVQEHISMLQGMQNGM